MRATTAAQMMGSLRPAPQSVPREGTKLRELYDALVGNRGLPIEGNLHTRSDNRVDQLRDFYGLDIRCLGRGRWVLAGEWFGRVYVDYIAERIAKAERPQ